ncbi:MAG: NAD(P)/FAD-dependent oxidoreductase [Thermicanus sp.]|nr:NAD(P)/FAD-dependent oxidoreductase [Thermicanus sp.]
MSERDEIVDITIIGGGPAGLFAAFYGGMRHATVKIIESMPQLGGQLAALYPEKYIYDVAGFPKIKAQDLVENLKKQALYFNPMICLEEKVLDLKKLEQENLFELTTDKGTHYSRSVIVAAGVGAFEPRRLELEDAKRFEKTNLYYFVSDMEQFRGERVVILGGGDSAVDWALMLDSIASEVHIVHRRDKFRAHEHSVEQLYRSHVHIHTSYDIRSLAGEKKIESITITHNKTGEELTLPLDALIVNYGFVSSLGPIQNWGLTLQKGAILVNSRMETNIPGVYAAGDIATYEGKIKLIAVGLGEAPTAVNNAKSYIDPTAKVQPGHSSSLTF